MRYVPRCIAWSLAAIAFMGVGPAGAEVLQITAQVDSSVREIVSGGSAQSDMASLAFPALTDRLPLAALTQLDRADPGTGDTVAGAIGQTLFTNTIVGGELLPDDFGMDLAAFSISKTSGWELDGHASQTRKIALRPFEVGLFAGQPVVATSTLFISGVLTISGSQLGKDLSGAASEMTFSIRQSGGGQTGGVLLEGGARLVGGANGAATVETSGAVNALLHPVVNLDGVVPELPVIRLVAFSAILPFDQYGYQYQVNVDEEFELTLDFSARVSIPPDGVAGAAVFGLPQANLAEIIQRVTKTDAGARAQDAIATVVDTSGSNAPTDVGGTVRPALSFPFGSLCGMFGPAGLSMLAAAWLATAGRVRRIRRWRTPRRV